MKGETDNMTEREKMLAGELYDCGDGEPKQDGSFEFCKTRTAPVIIGDNVWIGGGYGRYC